MKKNNQYKILVIDDDSAIVDATKMILELEGYLVQGQTEGHSIKKIIEYKPDLIFLDLWLSNMDGRQFCQKLKANPETKNIPVLFFSASRSIELNAKQAQADAYLSKPFEMDLLLEKVRELLKID